MKIVIEVSDTLMEYIVKGRDLSEEQNDEMALAIANGTPLPEHHGRLIDADMLKNNIHYVPIAPIFQDDYVTYRNVIFADILDMLPIIIEGSDTE